MGKECADRAWGCGVFRYISSLPVFSIILDFFHGLTTPYREFNRAMAEIWAVLPRPIRQFGAMETMIMKWFGWRAISAQSWEMARRRYIENFE